MPSSVAMRLHLSSLHGGEAAACRFPHSRALALGSKGELLHSGVMKERVEDSPHCGSKRGGLKTEYQSSGKASLLACARFSCVSQRRAYLPSQVAFSAAIGTSPPVRRGFHVSCTQIVQRQSGTRKRRDCAGNRRPVSVIDRQRPLLSAGHRRDR